MSVFRILKSPRHARFVKTFSLWIYIAFKKLFSYRRPNLTFPSFFFISPLSPYIFLRVYRDAVPRVGFLTKINFTTKFRNKQLRNYASSPNPTTSKTSMWHSITKRWEWSVPAGVGISLFAIFQLKYFWRHTHSGKDQPSLGPINGFMVPIKPFDTLKKSSTDVIHP